MHSLSNSLNQQTASNQTASSTSSRDAKLEQIIQNFYTKTAQIIIQGRTSINNNRQTGAKGSGSSSKKLNNWFNIATEDAAALRDELRYWRSLSATDQEVLPMIIDIYLDTSKLSTNQTLSAVDDNLRWGYVDVKNVDHILIETWVLKLKSPGGYSVDLPNLYKRSIIFFRSLHSFVRLLPAYDLYRNIRKANESNPLSIGYRLSSDSNENFNLGVPLDSIILENDARMPTSNHVFSDIITSMGTFNLSVKYRRNCGFKIDDIERDISAQFMNMDNGCFTPTMRKHQEECSRSQPNTPKESSSTSSRAPSEISQSRPKENSSASSSRLASTALTISPFKSPFLSSSPQADSLFSTAMTSRQSTPLTTSRQGLESGSFGRKIEFYSSFDKYKSSPTGRLPDSPSLINYRRLSRASDHSFISQEDDDLREFLMLMTPNQENLLFQKRNKTTPSPTTDTSSSLSKSLVNKKAELSHFRDLRDTYTCLSESLSSSIMITNNSNEPGSSPVSSTSSTSRSYQPVIPSPLHVQQRSISPVHIPRSYPQFRYTLPCQSSNVLAKIHGERDCDMSAYSTYPQDSLHQDVHNMSTHSTTVKETHQKDSSGHYIKGTQSTLDDDDLVFKMSELGCESPLQSQDQQMFYNRLDNNSILSRNPERSINLTKETKPTSPPLLEHIQKSAEEEP